MNGEGPGSTRSLYFIEVSQIILQEADQPDLVIDLEYANGLASNGGANSGADIRIWNLME